ncbi:HlyC/CorC family transporter [Candidatus Peregrinibacteria bacterium]|jgi:putative hemolysin|nr:HlyC/CorC family transporter [Candidatus Peregrinibacteria bacterium]
MELLILYIFIAIFFSFLCSIAEAVLLSVTPTYIALLEQKKNKLAGLLKELKDDIDRPLAAILTLNTIAHTVGAAAAGAQATKVLGNEFLGIISAILTLLILVFSEIIPKTLGAVYWQSMAPSVARNLRFLIILLYPLVRFSEVLTKMISRGKATNIFSRDEFVAMADLEAKAGGIDYKEREMIENVLEFGKSIVEEVMTPQKEMKILSNKTSLHEAGIFLRQNHFSRVPVFDSTDPEKIIGILTVQDLLHNLDNRSHNSQLKDIDLKPVLFVPETKLLINLFKEFQWRHIHMAIVVNEHGSTAGLVTLEDLLEELVGEIMDEADDEEQRIKKISQNSWSVDARIDLEELADNLEIEAFSDFPKHKSIAYLMLQQLGKIPKRGEMLKYHGCQFIIENIECNRINRVRVIRL